MSRAACAKEIINSQLAGKFSEFNDVHAGVRNVLASPDFQELQGHEQEALIGPLLTADGETIKAMEVLIRSYEKTAARVLEALR